MLTHRLNTAVMCLALMAAPVLHAQVRVINPRIQHGQEVAAKVHQMIAANPHLQAAIARLESRGTHSHPEAATVISGTAVRSSSVTSSSLPFGATATISGDDIEITFIPNTYSYGYWDGTVDAKRYDGNGNMLDEYIGNVTGESADPSSGLDCVYEDVVYGYDAGGDYGDGGGGGGGPYELSVPNPDKGERHRMLPGGHDGVRASGGTVNINKWLGHWGGWGKCAGAWCGGAAAGCAVGNAIDGEIGWLPCTAVGCIGGAIGCTYGTLWN
jgi:hypothetical protein